MFKKRIVPLFLILSMLIMLLIPESSYAENVVVGSAGSVPGGGVAGNGGICYETTPTFAVQFVSETYRTPLVMGDPADIIKQKTINQFKDHYAGNEDITNTIFFAPPNPYALRSSASIAWCDLSNGSLSRIKNTSSSSDLYDYKLRPISGTGSNSNIYYEQFMDAIDDASKPGIPADKSALSGYKWRQIAYKQDTKAKALALWSYLLENNANKLNERLNSFLKSAENSDTLDGRNRQACAWVDLMASLWTLSPPGQWSDNYANEIERFLKDDNTSAKPPLISISTAVLVRAPAYSPEYIFIRSVDYVHFIGGFAPKASLYKPRSSGDYTSKGFKQLIEDAANDSLKELPKRSRTTSQPYYGVGEYDAFNRGQSLVISARLNTRSGTAEVKDSSNVGAIESIRFSNSLYGFAVALPFGLNPPVKLDGKFSIKITAPKDETTILDPTDMTPKQNINLNLEMKQADPELGRWKSKLSGTFEANYPQIKINLDRTAPIARQSDTTTPSPTPSNPKLSTVADWKGNDAFKHIPKNLLLSLIDGTSTINYTDEILNYPLPQDTTVDQTVQFDYTCTVEIKLKSTDQPIKLIARNANDNDPHPKIVSPAKRIFKRPKQDPSEYTLTANYYLQGTNTSVSKSDVKKMTLKSGTGTLSVSDKDLSPKYTKVDTNRPTATYNWNITSGDKPTSRTVNYYYSVPPSTETYTLIAKHYKTGTTQEIAEETSFAQSITSGTADLSVSELEVEGYVPAEGNPESPYAWKPAYGSNPKTKTVTYYYDPAPPVRMGYVSAPSYWSEIKQGTPGDEEFEAMAGIPTTRNLYFSSGGSEYIVEVELEYVQDTEIERTYKSHYTGGVDCEFKAGDTAGDYNVPSPVGATSVDTSFNAHTGGTVTASWSYTVANRGVAGSLTGYNAGTPGSPCAGSGANTGNAGDITWTNVWDAAVYNTAVTNAKNWQTAVNAYIVKYTSASDKLQRSWNSWGASLSGNTWGDSITASQWESYEKQVGSIGSMSGYVAGNHGHGGSCPGNDKLVSAAVPATETSAGKDAVYGPCGSVHSCGSYTPATKTTVTKVSDKTFTITVTATIPQHVVCGPCCTHVLPQVEDTWKQKIKFDHLKVNVARVWKLDQAAIGGMIEITGTEEFKATVVEGEPNIFYNIGEDTAEKIRQASGRTIDPNSSEAGRLRYTLETNQHDDVVWNEGARTNKCNGFCSNGVSSGNGHSSNWATGILYYNNAYTNEKDYHRNRGGTNSIISNTADSKDVATTEWAKFNQRRTTLNTGYVISDMLILQTSSGDQSIIYFHKSSTPKQTQENFDKVAATKQEMWDNNPLSFARKEPGDINIGSYNGMFYNPTGKYSRYIYSPVATIFDTMPAGLERFARPAAALKLYNNSLNIIDIIDTIPNGVYYTGKSSVFYRNILNFGGGTPFYDIIPNSNFGADGAEFESTYSDTHSKINDIVIHNPVSAEFAMVVPLNNSRDQRTTASKLNGGNLQEPLTEYVRRLKNPLPKQNLIYNGDAEGIDTAGKLINWLTSGTAIFGKEQGTSKLSGVTSFRIETTTSETAFYYVDIPATGGTSYTFSGNKSGAGILKIEELDLNGTVLQTRGTGIFTTNAATATLRVKISKEGAAGVLYADDLVLHNNDVNTWIPQAYTVNEYSTAPNPNYVPEHTIPNPDYVPASPGTTTTFGFTGDVQEFTAPATGTYTLEVWGAQGGSNGGLGGYSKGTVNLTSGQTIYVYAGGTPTAPGPSWWSPDGYYINIGSVGGWNGGGSVPNSVANNGGGGATDIRIGGQSLSNRVIVAGGGGGYGCWAGQAGANGYGGAGGGVNGGDGAAGQNSTFGRGGTQSSGGAAGSSTSVQATSGSLGQGGNGAYSSTTGYNPYYQISGGGGGGYYGGGGGSLGSSWYYNGGGGGGSGYIGGVTGGTMSSGVNSGNGYAKITLPATTAVGAPTVTVPAVGSPTIESVQPIVQTITSAPESWYETVEVTIPVTQPVTIPGNGTFTPANFINLDYGFSIYFPNKGNFFGDNGYGLANVSHYRGKGFVNDMNTKEWTKEKYVSFDFNTIFDGVAYPAGQDIPLDINDADGIYNFYCPLANYEAVSAGVTFKVIATNGGSIDNTYAANRERYGYMDARHSGVKRFNVDVVGRIGNLIMEDSGDFRFANLFKQPKNPVSWLVPNVVKKVELGQQYQMFGSQVDIRGLTATAGNHWLDTYGLLDFADRQPMQFPLTPDKNNIKAMRAQPMRLGYKGYMDIQTLGNYSQGSIEIIPYYYRLDLKTGQTKQVDIYMSVDGQYKPINIFGAAVPDWNPNIVYNNVASLNWDSESLRRNYTAGEKARTEAVSAAFKVYDTNGNAVNMPIPSGQYHAFGNSQLMQLNGKNRTFIGTSTVCGSFDANPGSVFQDILFGLQAQRWHFTTGLPSSAVAVEHGLDVTQQNINALRNNSSVLLMALDIKAYGDTYVLQYTNSGENNSVTIAKIPLDLSSIPYPIIGVISIDKSSADDLEVRGTH